VQILLSDPRSLHTCHKPVFLTGHGNHDQSNGLLLNTWFQRNMLIVQRKLAYCNFFLREGDNT